MFWRWKKKSNVIAEMTSETEVVAAKVNFFIDVSEDEKAEVLAHLAKEFPDEQLNVKSIKLIDQDKEAAAVIAASVLANAKPTSTFRLISIEECEGRNENA